MWNDRSSDGQRSVKPARILGVLGGMGPEATVDFYREIIRLTPASRDQDHIPTLIYSLPQIPDRTASIQSGDRSIIDFLVEGVTRLENAGASFIAIPCNTVHRFFDEMQNAVSIPILHMMEETASYVKTKIPSMKTIGLLATSGTIATRLYEDALEAAEFQVIVPGESVQKNHVMEAIYMIKAGENKASCENLLTEAGNHVIEKGAEAIVLGCTEIPLGFNAERVSVPVINATEVLALAALRMYQEGA